MGDLTRLELDIALKELEVRGNIVRERRKEMEAVDRALTKQRHMLDLVGGVADLIPSTSGPGANVGTKAGTVIADKFNVGGMLGNMLLPGAGGIIGELIGSGITSLFDKDAKQQEKQTQALQRIDQNTRQAAHTLELSRQWPTRLAVLWGYRPGLRFRSSRLQVS